MCKALRDISVLLFQVTYSNDRFVKSIYIDYIWMCELRFFELWISRMITKVVGTAKCSIISVRNSILINAGGRGSSDDKYILNNKNQVFKPGLLYRSVMLCRCINVVPVKRHHGNIIRKSRISNQIHCVIRKNQSSCSVYIT